MVKLKNIKKNNATIECDIYPEDSKQSGHVTVALDSRTVSGYSLPNGYEWCRNHVNHAKTALIELLEAEDLPTEYLVKWY
ncbi:MAG: hypothetical protein Q4D16_03450 [Eubacteriales bacterium]|nr:hypothetical protein [Eubacteriales bacterium]